VGKTTFAHLLAARAIGHPSNVISNVVHIRECTACPDQTKATCYSTSQSEKTTRAALKSEFDRAISGGGGSGSSSGKKHNTNTTLVILDSLNYIKGYRYELYCISKAAGERHGVIWVTTSDCSNTNANNEVAKSRNVQRMDHQIRDGIETSTATTSLENNNNALHLNNDRDGWYQDDATIDALVLRYEPPDDKNRWENPLYTVDVTSVLPWGKEGTLLEVTTNNVIDENAKSLIGEMNVMSMKENAPSSDVAESKPVIKSASGFKRRGNKSIEKQHLPMNQPQLSAVTTPVPISMASRNLKHDIDDHNTPDQFTKDSKPRRIEDVIDSILDSFLLNVAPLQEGISTQKQISAESNMLNEVDNLTQRINNEILKAQQTMLVGGLGGTIYIQYGTNNSYRRAMNLSKPLYLNELRTIRKGFLKWTAAHPMPSNTNEETMVEVYISYIESNI
jgi:protein KTI12